MGGACHKSAGLNEWLIVIENGEMKKAGIGMKTFYNPMSTTVATFPSSVTKVQFSAEQISKEMQGVRISGVVMWSVNREDDGPFKFYKYSGDGTDNVSENLRLVSESIVRNLVANTSISEVMTHRDYIRTTLKKSIMDAVAGWGVWVETVELTDIVISSKALFEDLQAEFRSSTHLNAEKTKLRTEQTVTEGRLAKDLAIAESRADTAARRKLYESQAAMRGQEEEAKLFEKQAALDEQKLEQEKKMRLRRIEIDRELQMAELDAKRAVDAARLQIELSADRERQEAALKHKAALMDLDARLQPANLQKLQIESAAAALKALPLEHVNMTVYGGQGEGQGWQLLPALGAFTDAMRKAADSKDTP